MREQEADYLTNFGLLIVVAVVVVVAGGLLLFWLRGI
jgi:hypothetical protein